MNLKELFQSIFDSSSERIKNPLVGSYIISFTLYNWRVIFFLIFSEVSIENKIIVIDNKYSNIEVILWPLAIAIFYILILPYINLIFDALLSYSNQRRKRRIREETISNLEQKKSVARYEREIADERAGTREVEYLNNKIVALEKDNELKSNEITELITRNNEEIQNWRNRFDELNNENDNLKFNLKNESIEHTTIVEIYNLLIDPRDSVIRDIKNYLRNNLSNDEFLTIRALTKKKDGVYRDLPLSWEKNALLLKAGVFEKDLGGFHSITEEGSKFILDLE